MFVLAKKETIKKVVSIPIPGDLGEDGEGELEVEYKKLSVKEMRAYQKKLIQLQETARETKDLAPLEKFVDDRVVDSIVNIDGLLNEDEKTAIKYSTKIAREIMNIDFVRESLVQGFNDVQSNASLREGN